MRFIVEVTDGLQRIQRKVIGFVNDNQTVCAGQLLHKGIHQCGAAGRNLSAYLFTDKAQDSRCGGGAGVSRNENNSRMRVSVVFQCGGFPGSSVPAD